MEGYLALIKEQREENDKLQQKVEQLKNIRKEAIKYIETFNFHCKNQVEQEKYDRGMITQEEWEDIEDLYYALGGE